MTDIQLNYKSQC